MTKTAPAAFLLVFVHLMASSQEIAVHKIPDSAREFMFQFKSDGARNDSIEGIVTVFARHFAVTKTHDLKIAFTDVLLCKNATDAHIVTAAEMDTTFPMTTRVLLKGEWMRLSDLTEQSFKARPPKNQDDHFVPPPPPGPPPNP